MEYSRVYTSRGSDTTLIKISPKDIQRSNQGKVARVRNIGRYGQLEQKGSGELGNQEAIFEYTSIPNIRELRRLK